MAEKIQTLGLTFSKTKLDSDFTNLVKVLRPGLLLYIKKIVKNNEIAEDILTETLYKIWSKIDSYSSKYHISTWTYRIARNEAYGYFRKQKTEVNIIPTDINNDTVIANKIEYIGSTKVNSQIIAEEYIDDQFDTLYTAINSLPVKYKEVIEEKYFNDLKYEDISDKLNLPLYIVKNRIHKAKLLIKKSIKNINI